MTEFPEFFRVRQIFDTPTVKDVGRAVQQQLAKQALDTKINPGESVAVTAGSRGIANIDRILKSIVEFLCGLGAKPFIVPAMGSHGGGTAEGQQQVIESYGITESFCGCPIRSSLETVVIGEATEGFPVYLDRHAAEADHVVVCGRVKPHTGFAGDIQSGLLKMMMIGLGKKDGATLYHQAIQDYGFPQIIRSVAPQVIDKANILVGVAIVENAYDQTGHIEAVAPQDFVSREKDLLRMAKEWMPKLPFWHADILIVDQIGKNISGTGMDTNIIGRKESEPAENQPKVKRIIVRGLTPETHGNACGLGFADLCLTRVVEQMDRPATVLNCVTACHLGAARVPIDYATDEKLLSLALGTIGLSSPREAKVMWIRNTLELGEIECSHAYLAEAESRDDLQVETKVRQLPLDSKGMLPSFTEFEKIAAREVS